MSTLSRLILTVILFGVVVSGSQTAAQTVRTKTIVRVFWQDRTTQKLAWANIITTNKWGIKRGWVDNFPDAAVHHPGPMVQSGGVLLVGVQGRNEQGQCGWVAIDSGVFEEPHGNHFHWRYTGQPTVTKSSLSAAGDAGRMFEHERSFFVGDNSDGGFSVMPVAALKQTAGGDSAKLHPGGGTDAFVAPTGSSAYATWNDEEGENAGRVDVVNLRKSTVAYSLKLPTSGVRAAIANAGKVFFAPADGLCWVNADTSASGAAATVAINHITLNNSSTPSASRQRTTGLSNMGSWVVCTTGEGNQAELCMLNAASPRPSINRLSIAVGDNLRPTEPQCILSLGKRYALIFHERIDPGIESEEKLTIIELDPNRDKNFRDARVRRTLAVGASQVEGNTGHHSVSFDAYGRYAVFTEPADGILNVLSLQKLQVVARFRVGGVPDKIIAIGAAEHFH